jgi:serine/threonine-protein kinase
MVQGQPERSSTGTRYEILEQLGFAVTHDSLARSTSSTGVERYCLLKQLAPSCQADAQLSRTFLSEARLAMELQHPNIESVYDAGTLGDSLFMAVEYVHGRPWYELERGRRTFDQPFPIACALTLIADLASALDHAHTRRGSDGHPLGIVHGDVTPGRVRVRYDGTAKLVDFGAARLDERARELPRGATGPKLTHLSPEQCRGEPIDRRSDLFTLGMMTWDLLTGQQLFRKDIHHGGEYGTLQAILREAAVPPSNVRPDVPREVDRIVLRLLAKSPDERFQRAAEVVEQIASAASAAGLTLSTAAVGEVMAERFGRPPEPWLATPPAIDAGEQELDELRFELPSYD